MNTLEQIIELIRLNKKPYLILKRKDGLNVVNAGVYRCDNCGKEDSPEAKVESAVKWLGDYIALFPKGTVFYLYMKASENANQSGILGAFEFMIKPDGKEDETINGIGGMTPGYEQLKQLGYVPEAEVKARLLEKELEFERTLHKRDLEDVRKEFNEKLEFTLQQSKTFSPETIRGIIKEFTPIVGILKGKEIPALSGIEETEQENGEEPKNDVKAASVNELARILYEKASLKDIENLKQVILKTEQKEQTNE